VFGDGNTAISQNPSDIYANPGAYTVQEIVSGPGGSSTNTQTASISVYDPFAWWQLQYFGSTNSNPNTAPDGDSTGTGMSNTNKFLAGFNPTNTAAYLHIISVANANNTDINVVYLGASGDSTWSPGIASRTNVLEVTAGAASGDYSNNFVSANVTNILSGGTGTGLVTNMVDAGGATNTPSRYYRVRVLLP
jgi:PKD repeat protein